MWFCCGPCHFLAKQAKKEGGTKEGLVFRFAVLVLLVLLLCLDGLNDPTVDHEQHSPKKIWDHTADFKSSSWAQVTRVRRFCQLK